MQILAQIIGELIVILLAFGGMTYADNSELKSANSQPAGEQVAMKIDVDSKLSKFSTQISLGKEPQCIRQAPRPATQFRKWRLSFTP